ncbi:immunity-related GTPase family M protein 3-like isoform X1 [Meriones unguiculatus]|uniref:immunity-related GTPase family M protein 3-like isoform X1 n=2 Tax=Meriones unguiculatus TaxID=10047 RepID=UPI000B4ED130|nr:immunity-related GTPase family M protein 3-like isoform X1 [Meriones unguiculatus]
MDSVLMLPHMAWKAFTLFTTKAKSNTDSESSYSSQIDFSREAEGISKAVAEGKLLDVIYIARDVMQTMSRYRVKIAVTGDSGNGMSSFINAIRGIGHEEVDSAPTGVVRTTQVPACYSSSSFPNVELWDLPGTGATAQSIEDYMEEMRFDAYDLFIIVASEQFSSNHMKLAKAVQEMGKRFYVVWTKLDRDLSTSALSEAQLLQSIRRNIQENLQMEQVKEPPIFLLSSFSPSFHDFPELRHTLQKDLDGVRYRDTLEALSQICDDSISSKELMLKGRMPTTHLEVAVSPVYDSADLEEALETYQKLFGVDDGSLQQVVQSTGTWTMQSQDLLKMDRRLELMTSFVMVMIFRFLGWSWWFGLWNFFIRGFRHQRHRLILRLVAKNTKARLRRALRDYALPSDSF